MAFNPFTPKICQLILPFNFYTFPCKLVMRILCQIKIATPDKFDYSHYMFAGLYMDILREKFYVDHFWELKG